MKFVIIALVLGVGAIVALVIYQNTREPEPEDHSNDYVLRRRYAQEFQDRMRDQAYGPDFTARTTGTDDDVLELGIKGCDREALRTITASPKIQRVFDDLGFRKMTCRVGGASVSAPW